MTKTFNNLFDKLLDSDYLYQSFLLAAKGKRNKPQVIAFTNNLPLEIAQLVNELRDGTYEPRPYNEFYVYEPKQRLIHAPHFRDVVVQRAIYDIISPIFEATFIHDSYGCRVGKGTHAASEQCHKYLKQSHPDSYYCQMDIRKYFFNVRKDVLMQMIGKKISDPKMLSLISKFLPSEIGMPIGNLLSQLFSNIYMNLIDQLLKRKLQAKRYIRYVDDFIMFGLDKAQIHHNLNQVVAALASIGLSLSRFTIQQCRRGVNFVGYRTYLHGKFLRKKSLKNFRNEMKLAVPTLSIISILGHAKPSRNFAQLVFSVLHKYRNHRFAPLRNFLHYTDNRVPT